MPRGGGNIKVGPVRAARNRPNQAPHRRERRRGGSGERHGRTVAVRTPGKKTRLPVRRRAPRARQLIHDRVPVLPSAPPRSSRAAGRPREAGERSPDPCAPRRGGPENPNQLCPRSAGSQASYPESPPDWGIRGPRRRARPLHRILCVCIATWRAFGASIVASRTRERGERVSQSSKSPPRLRAGSRSGQAPDSHGRRPAHPPGVSAFGPCGASTRSPAP